MHHCVFAAPFALESTLRFVAAAASLRGVRLAVLSQEPVERIPEELRRRLQGFVRVDDAMSADSIVRGVRQLASQLHGRIDSLIGILEPLQVPLAEARVKLGLPGTGPDAARNMRDKARMKDVLAAHGLPCARHALCATRKEAVAFAERTGFPLVVKPPAGAGAKATFRVENLDQLDGALRATAPKPEAKVLLEEFIVGDEFSFDSMSIEGRHVFHSISCYSPTPLEVLSEPWIQWTVLLPRDISGPEFAAIRDAGPRALDALGMRTGMTHMEWFRRPDGSIAISEVAARPPGAQFTSLISWAHDMDFYTAWARVVTTGEFRPPERRYATGAAYLRAQGEGTKIARVTGLEHAQQELGSLVVESKLPEAGKQPADTYEGEGWVILRHPDTDVVKRGLRRILELVRVELG